MPQKPQHARDYRAVRTFIRELREGAGLTQRALGAKLRKPQSWVYNCEVGNRRVDLAEFINWCLACGVGPLVAFKRYLARR
jgi:hypothetical protein